MGSQLTERALDDLPEPTRGRALELLWLLRESGHEEEMALQLARRGAQAETATLRDVKSAPRGAG